MSSTESSLRFDEHAEWTASELALALPTFCVGTTCADAFEWFRQNPTQVAAAIVDEMDRVVGIVNRLRFLERYAQRFTPELYSKRSITKLANLDPLVVDGSFSVSELGKVLTVDRRDALLECFVVTRNGRYFGVGTTEALVRSKVAILIDREAKLEAALLAAEDASRTKSNFLALMSHELRTPLNAIIGFSEMLSSEMLGPHTVPRYRDYANDIHGAGRHLLALINDILDLSKSEAGQFELYPEEVDMTDLVKDCLKLISGRAREKGLKINNRIAADLPPFYVDALRVKQILVNLLSNAVKFTPAGGEVGITAALAEDDGLIVQVCDTGMGMAPEMIPIALEPFRQLESPLARKGEGTGLGLSLVKRLTELHGGEISIRSALQCGTTVELRFPKSRTVVNAAKLRA